jgi:hypothetical protein
MSIGLYFIFIRPVFLPEDLRYMNTTLSGLNETIPGLQTWLKKVFWVFGGYIFTTGLFTFYISRTTFRARAKGAFGIVMATGISSIGFMVFVNFMIGSDFKWILLTCSFMWMISLVLYRLRK